MVLSKRMVLMVAMVVGLPGLLARAKDESPKTPATEAKAADAKAADAQKASPEEIAKLVEQLDAERFNDRQAASQKLAGVGKAAVAALAKAAVGESLEVTTRAIGILGKYLESTDQETRDAAKTALEGIAKSDKPAAARRAQELIKPQTQEQQPGGQGRVVQGVVQIQVGGAGASRRSMKNVNGVKEIEAEENGKKVKITDDPKNGIKIEATSKKDGKDVTEKYEAKDAKELEKKHPEGYKLYKEYAENQGGMGAIQLQIQGGGIQIIPGQGAIPLPQLPGVLPAPRAGAHGVEAATRLMQTLGKQIEVLTKDLKEAPKEAKEDLKKQIGELKKQLSDLEKQIEEK
jgi:hypothetical protein